MTFNPPCISTENGLRQSLPQSRSSQWHGGPDGTTVISQFLHAVVARGHTCRCLIGVNPMHVPSDVMLELIGRHPELALRESHRAPPLPTVVYVCDKLSGVETATSAPADVIQ